MSLLLWGVCVCQKSIDLSSYPLLMRQFILPFATFPRLIDQDVRENLIKFIELIQESNRRKTLQHLTNYFMQI